MFEYLEIYRILYNHRSGTGSTLIAVRNLDELELACNEFEHKYRFLGYDIQDIEPDVVMTPRLFTPPDKE